MDEIEDNCQYKEVHALLIINPFRTKALNEREPIHEKQINLAIKYNSLIIETTTLLQIFELFQRGEIDSERCREVFKTQIGLLKIEDVKK
ncbi:hypothetical protein SAMN02910370_00821 [Lachnospiraceae bacterium XPB1003]|nr:hypothetical protein SAMN02910370_00821 [Lachnospiraceae bacterium XPB1003]